MGNLSEMMEKATLEQIEKIKDCTTVEEIIAVAKTESFEITSERAEEILKMIFPPNGEISDEELDNIAGGSSKEGPKCPRCGSTNVESFGFDTPNSKCRECGYIFI